MFVGYNIGREWHKELVGHLAKESKEELNKKAVYERFKLIGLEYGFAFQGITSLVRIDDRSAYATVDFTHVDNTEMRFKLHPCILDVCFQVCPKFLRSVMHTPDSHICNKALLGSVKQLTTAYVPVSVEAISFQPTLPNTFVVFARVTKVRVWLFSNINHC